MDGVCAMPYESAVAWTLPDHMGDLYESHIWRKRPLCSLSCIVKPLRLGNVVLESLYKVMSEVGVCFPVDVFGTRDAQTMLATWGHSWKQIGI